MARTPAFYKGPAPVVVQMIFTNHINANVLPEGEVIDGDG